MGIQASERIERAVNNLFYAPISSVISVICGKKIGKFVKDEHGGIR